MLLAKNSRTSIPADPLAFSAPGLKRALALWTTNIDSSLQNLVENWQAGSGLRVRLSTQVGRMPEKFA